MGKCRQHSSIREKRDAEIGNSLENSSKMLSPALSRGQENYQSLLFEQLQVNWGNGSILSVPQPMRGDASLTMSGKLWFKTFNQISEEKAQFKSFKTSCIQVQPSSIPTFLSSTKHLPVAET